MRILKIGRQNQTFPRSWQDESTLIWSAISVRKVIAHSHNSNSAFTPWQSYQCPHLQVTRERTAEEAAADIASLLGGEAPDVCIECSGAEPSIRSESDQAYPSLAFLSKHWWHWQTGMKGLRNVMGVIMSFWTERTKWSNQLILISPDYCHLIQIAPARVSKYRWEIIALYPVNAFTAADAKYK